MATISYWKEIVNKNLPFVLYRVPKEEPCLLAQKDKNLKILEDGSEAVDEQGFAFVPWIGSEEAAPILIRADIFHQGWEEIMQLQEVKKMQPKVEQQFYITPPSEHRHQVEQIKHAIKNGDAEKVILSRIKEVPKLEIPPLEVFKDACIAYPDAFAYLLYTPETGYWMGASPEMLLKKKGNTLETAALAGTQTDKGKKLDGISWGSKEKHEHKVVADYIHERLEQYCTNVKTTGAKTVKAGNVLHLKTIFTATVEGDSLADFVDDLHPTPAIAGLSKDSAIDLIAQIEKHDRSYYTGFLGPVNIDDATHLYVNLRCMQMMPDRMMIYVGSGITAGSEPLSEWTETESKAQTMTRLLDSFDKKFW